MCERAACFPTTLAGFHAFHWMNRIIRSCWHRGKAYDREVIFRVSLNRSSAGSHTGLLPWELSKYNVQLLFATKARFRSLFRGASYSKYTSVGCRWPRKRWRHESIRVDQVPIADARSVTCRRHDRKNEPVIILEYGPSLCATQVLHFRRTWHEGEADVTAENESWRCLKLNQILRDDARDLSRTWPKHQQERQRH